MISWTSAAKRLKLTTSSAFLPHTQASALTPSVCKQQKKLPASSLIPTFSEICDQLPSPRIFIFMPLPILFPVCRMGRVYLDALLSHA